jgi:transposase
MDEIATVGLDTAKHIFHVHGVDKDGTVTVRRQLRRSGVLKFFERLPRCLVGLEACGGAHHWAREIAALDHDVRLIPPAYVKPYVKRGKNDAIDAEAICEAVTRPTMRFVPVKTASRQASGMLLKTRDLLVRQRTQAINALRGHLGELGITAARGVGRVGALTTIVRDKTDERLPPVARMALEALADQIEACTGRIAKLEQQIASEVRRDPTMRRLATVPGIGPITAATIVALVPDPGVFTSARHFAAWIGLTPKMHSTGGKDRLGRISKNGEPCLAVTPRRGRNRRNAARSTWRSCVCVVGSFVGSPSGQSRIDRMGQQNGPDRLGTADKGRHVLASKRCGGCRLIGDRLFELAGEAAVGQGKVHVSLMTRGTTSRLD